MRNHVNQIDDKIRDIDGRIERFAKIGGQMVLKQEEEPIKLVISLKPVERLLQKADFYAIDYSKMLNTFPFLKQSFHQTQEGFPEAHPTRRRGYSGVFSTDEDQMTLKAIHSGDEGSCINISIKEHGPSIITQGDSQTLYFGGLSPPHQAYQFNQALISETPSPKKRTLEFKDIPGERRISSNLSNSGSEQATRDLKKLYRYVDELISSETKKTNHENIINKESANSFSNTFGMEGDAFIGASIAGENLGARRQTAADMAKIKVKVFHPVQFAVIRHLSGIDHVDFVTSMSETFAGQTNFTGGKTKAKFYKTFDELFIIKQVSESEMTSFLSFAPNYLQYIFEKIVKKRPFAISRLFGCFEVESTETGKKEFLFVMENVANGLVNKESLKLFDLKGSEKNRFSSSIKSTKQTLLDTNFKIMMNGEPLLIDDANTKIMESVTSDAGFLSRQSIVDYSLLVAVDPILKQCRFAIIDYASLYTTFKQLENKYKIIRNLGELPTIIQPDKYFYRFVREIGNDIVVVPTFA